MKELDCKAAIASLASQHRDSAHGHGNDAAGCRHQPAGQQESTPLAGIDVQLECRPPERFLQRTSLGVANQTGLYDVYYPDQSWIARFTGDTSPARASVFGDPAIREAATVQAGTTRHFAAIRQTINTATGSEPALPSRPDIAGSCELQAVRVVAIAAAHCGAIHRALQK